MKEEKVKERKEYGAGHCRRNSTTPFLLNFRIRETFPSTRLHFVEEFGRRREKRLLFKDGMEGGWHGAGRISRGI